MHTDVALLKRVFLTHPQQGVVDRAVDVVLGKFKLSELKKFEGAMSAKDLEISSGTCKSTLLLRRFLNAGKFRWVYD